MPPRLLRSALALAALAGCHGPRASDPEPGPPQADVLAAFDPAALAGAFGEPPEVAPAPALAVVDYGPQGRTEGNPTIKVRFNQPVVPLGVEQPADLAGRISIDPPLAGKLHFQTPELLVFEPADALVDATRYTVRLAPGLSASGGSRLEQGLEWTFETPRPRVEGLHQPGADGREYRRRDSRYVVEFTQPTSLAEARAHLQAIAIPADQPDAPGRPVPVRISVARESDFGDDAWYLDPADLPGHYYTVRPQGLWPADSDITLEVTPGLRGDLGPLPLDTPWSDSFTTYGPQQVDEFGCEGTPRCGLQPFELVLRNPITARQAKKISVSPRPKDLRIEVVDADGAEGGQNVTLDGIFLPGTTYTITVDPDLRDIYGQTLAQRFTGQVRVERRPALALPQDSGTLIPARKQTIGVETRFVQELRVRTAVLDEKDLVDRTLRETPMPATARERRIALAPKGPGGWASTALDLAELTGGARGPVLVEIEAAGLVPGSEGAAPKPVRGLFRLTDLGPVVVPSVPRTAVQVLRLSDSAPVVGARVARFVRGAKGLETREVGVTDADGLLVLAEEVPPTSGAAPGPAEETLRSPLVITDPATGDRTSIHADASPAASSWPLRPGERLIARVIADRGAYRPGETVKVVGWSAVDTPFARSNLARLPKGTDVKLRLLDRSGTAVAEQETTTTAEGKFWGELRLPGGAKLGDYRVEAVLADARVEARLEVEDFRTPEFSVTASVAQRDRLIGESAAVRVASSYYFGGPAPIHRLSFHTSCQPGAYRPPGLDARWIVGAPITGRRAASTARLTAPPDPAAPAGLREVALALPSALPDAPQLCSISAAVMDASFQEIGAETSVQLHPAPIYVALALPARWQRAGERVSVPVRAVDVAGARAAASGVTLTVTREWGVPKYRAEDGRQVYAGHEDKRERVKLCTLDLPASGEDPRCELPPLEEGTYHLAAELRVGEDRKARTEGQFYVAPKPRPRANTSVAVAAPPRLTLSASATELRPGEPLEVTVQTPWQGSRGLLVLDRGGLREARSLRFVDNTARFDFEADDTWSPGVRVQAIAVEPLRSGRTGPVVRTETLGVRQGVEHRRLRVSVRAPAGAGPGDAIELGVAVRDDADRPVAARVALWAVDEAVLALTDYAVPDLVPAFVPGAEGGTRVVHDYDAVMLPFVAEPDDPWLLSRLLWGHGSGSGSGYGGRSSRSASVRGGAAATVPAARERFETTPVFLADLAAGADGEARVKAELPQNLTTFRIFAVASSRLADGTSPGRFGVGDARTTVSTPLVLRAAAPRQLRPGDVAEVAAIVQNYTDRAGEVVVTAKVHDDAKSPGRDLVLLSPGTDRAQVPAGGQARVAFQVRADAPGEARLELRADLRVAGEQTARDAIKVPVPVEHERTLTERVAVYGTLADDRAVAIPVKLPAAVLPGVGGVSVSATSSLLGELQDAVDALLNYPYGCVEQTASRLLPVIALASLPNYPLGLDADPRAFVEAGVERLLSMQVDSGGFSYWPGDRVAHFYASAYATWVLRLAQDAGHPVPASALERAHEFLAAGLGDRKKRGEERWLDDTLVRRAIALHVLADAGRPVRDDVDALYQRRAELPVYARAFLLMAMHRGDPQRPEVGALLQELLGAVEELPASAHTVERAGWDMSRYFHSERRSDAITLLALLRVRPEHPLAVKLARGLLEKRSGGAWRNTQENAYALLAIAEYAKVYEATEPDFIARAWVGRKPVFQARFEGRDLQTRASTAAMPEILQPQRGPRDPLTVVLQREGQGRLYYRLGAEWAPADPSPPAKEHGLALTRRLRLADGPLESRQIPIGAAIAVDLTLTTRTRVPYVAVDVPIPAGLEAVQMNLGKGQSASTLSGPRGAWVSHEELRRDRVLVFADDLSPGTHVHTVYLRATSRGEYRLPPAAAEAMYMPEVFGRSEGAQVAVR